MVENLLESLHAIATIRAWNSQPLFDYIINDAPNKLFFMRQELFFFGVILGRADYLDLDLTH